MRNRNFVRTLSILASVFIFAGCASANVQTDVNVETNVETQDVEITAAAEPETEQAESETLDEYVFTDALGREVTVSNTENVAVLLGSFFDIWQLAGGEASAVVSDAFGTYDIAEGTVDLGRMLEPNVEALIAAQPDFVIASAGTDAQVELLDTFEAAGLNVAYFEVSNFDDYLAMLDICTDITGRKDLYEQYGTQIADQIDDILGSVPDTHPTVLFIRAAASSVKAKGSEGTVGSEILADLGCINIADSNGAILDDLSLEAIVAADPDFIFVTTQGEDKEAALANVQDLLINNPAWSQLSAVTSGHYYEIEKELYNSKPNARWAEAYEKLANILYGE
ncbi:MAG: ABC transporter substrate-binding protein [Lachnospiraceae bacterium]|nr:ABC transporter substrate-binding protein [Lachnospiraceae bacterium]